MRRALALGFVAALAAIPAGAAPRADTSPPSRAFTVRAEAFPVEPAPGTNETSLGARPYAVRALVSNPPANAHALAAAADLGIIENYSGAVGPRAEADSDLANVPRDATADAGPGRLEAHADQTPSARGTATGADLALPGGTAHASSSRGTAQATADLYRAEIHTELHGVSLGPLEITSLRYDALAVTTGKPGGARASGHLTVGGATVNGIPAVVDSDGVTVDRTKVPAAQAEAFARAITQALSQGGYIQIHVVDPTVATAADGSGASVTGGGLRVRLTNNDPTQLYFADVTLAGGRVEALLGGEGASVPAAIGAGGVGLPGGSGALAAEPVRAGALDAGAPVPPASTPRAPAAPPRLTFHVARATRSLATGWRGWPWLAGGVVALALAGSLVRRRIVVAAAGLADRYFRG